jgi:hypothetical protein
MNPRSSARLLYRLLLRLHPAGFRQRFGEEMLWIFDCASHQTAYMLYDGVRSVIIQHAKFDVQEDVAAPFCLEVKASSLTLARLCQAALLSTLVLFALASVIGREMPSAWYLDHDQQPTCQQTDELGPSAILKIRQR